MRRELFTQCFDELIRQAAINCGERGLLLLRVRDEFRQTIAGYQSLYESSIAFGMRKALQVRETSIQLSLLDPIKNRESLGFETFQNTR